MQCQYFLHFSLLSFACNIVSQGFSLLHKKMVKMQWKTAVLHGVCEMLYPLLIFKYIFKLTKKKKNYTTINTWYSSIMSLFLSMDTSSVASSALSPESTVTSLLSRSGHLRSSLVVPEHNTTFRYRDKVLLCCLGVLRSGYGQDLAEFFFATKS